MKLISWTKYKNDSLDFLKRVPDEQARIAFYDPQYRGVLDKLKYGNEGARQKGRANLPSMTEEYIKEVTKELERTLRPSGYVFFWVDKFHLLNFNLAEGTSLQVVDMITWDKERIGMGHRSRRRSEYLIVLQKKPIKAKATWTDHSIPDVWQERIRNPLHPHQKPAELIKSLVLATTDEDDWVIDPCAGSFVVNAVCQSINRHFLGTDITTGEVLMGKDIPTE